MKSIVVIFFLACFVSTNLLAQSQDNKTGDVKAAVSSTAVSKAEEGSVLDTDKPEPKLMTAEKIQNSSTTKRRERGTPELKAFEAKQPE